MANINESNENDDINVSLSVYFSINRANTIATKNIHTN